MKLCSYKGSFHLKDEMETLLAYLFTFVYLLFYVFDFPAERPGTKQELTWGGRRGVESLSRRVSSA